MRFLWQSFNAMLSAVLIGAVRCYQYLLSPIFGRNCLYTPTCSHYYIGAVKKYGPIIGSFKGFWRICRCNPFS
ncbi:MAG: membrane protein insertion efficiency factor YidD, partial [Pirellulales bacterium]